MTDRFKNKSISYSNIRKLGILSNLYTKENLKSIETNKINYHNNTTFLNNIKNKNKFEILYNFPKITSFDYNNKERIFYKNDLDRYKRKEKLEKSLKIGDIYFYQNEKVKKDLEIVKNKFKNNKIENNKIKTFNNLNNKFSIYDKFQKNINFNYNELNNLDIKKIANPLSQRIESYSLNLLDKEKKEISNFVDKSLKKSQLNNIYSKERYGDNSNTFTRSSVRKIRKSIHELMKERDRIIFKKHLIFVKEFPHIEKEINNLSI